MFILAILAMERLGMCFWMDSHTQGYISTDTSTVAPQDRSEFTDSDEQHSPS